MKCFLLITPALLLLCSIRLHAQDQPPSGLVDKVFAFPSKLFGKVQKSSDDLNKQITSQTQKCLARLATREARMKRKLARVDSTKAASLFNGTEIQYAALEQKISSNAVPIGTGTSGEYLARLDSLKTGLSFLQQNPQLLASVKNLNGLNSSLSSVQQLQAKIQSANDVQQFISGREQQLKAQLSQYSFGKELSEFNQQTYYYQQRLTAYKSTLQDKDKMEQAAFTQLNKISSYQAFMAKNSYLGRLFGLPNNYGSPASIVGLQTKDVVKGMIGKLGGGGMSSASGGNSAGGGGLPGGGDPSGFVQQQLGSAQQQLVQLQNKVTQLALPGGGSGAVTMPDFEPNSQKTKTFLKRIEYGFDLQTQKSNYLAPTATAIALKLGYKLSDKSSVGVGASYNLGLGNGLNHIAFSNQGVGLRSYLDIKAKGSLWISGGFEYNYLAAFAGINDIKNFDLWQRSALLGITKKYKVTKNKTGTLQLLYDALYQTHIPQSTPLMFRMGYQF